MRELVSRADLHLPPGSATDGTDPVVVTPEHADWRFTGLRVVRLEAGDTRTIETGDCELAVLPLQGGCTVECEGRSFQLAGRDSVFARVSDFAYVPRDCELRISSTAGGEFALPTARSRRHIDPYYGDSREVAVEVRGAGACTRQITNFLAPGAFDADRLTCVEVITPRGNWSSYPPHKHDDPSRTSGEAELEEIYYFKLRPGEHAWGAHRTYCLEQDWDVSVTVYSDSVFLVPRGYHGPCMAPPDFDMWYLNVLAGPAVQRSLAFSDDPRYAFARDAWNGQQPDPRLPMTGSQSCSGDHVS